ncbi:hypothetical protein BD324DRAFT_649306 [Kockovaella imperatae]|uniref:Uncharacterized protein n=1 Tax=Kockovaella imperatae TaxID=4999 RepID=A0A1Y1UMK6_9TREE|nr:hypothetical protein BD324DRAFT_649306 [Kockovaella imperatae]ORX39222.1 hypothetical protein BD324DRAFT_649306 [Kockovaella imperatae]
MSTAKQRHYAALASRLRALKTNLAESEVQMDALARHLDKMRHLGANHAAQFMAVSRILDVDLEKEKERVQAAYDAEAQEPEQESA